MEPPNGQGEAERTPVTTPLIVIASLVGIAAGVRARVVPQLHVPTSRAVMTPG